MGMVTPPQKPNPLDTMNERVYKFPSMKAYLAYMQWKRPVRLKDWLKHNKKARRLPGFFCFI